MPSIFIWKATTPNTSKKTIRFYSGSNWALEDNDYSSKSYIYLNQIVISECNNSVITFQTKDMPADWVGTELLEVTNIPYEIVKTDGYGTLEKIGTWMRFISKNECNFEEESLKNEFSNIKKWINQKNKQYSEKPHKYQQMQPHHQKTHQYHTPQQKYNNTKSLDQQQVQLNFQEFLIKYTQSPSQFPSYLNTSNNQISETYTHNYKKVNYNANKTKSNGFKV
jgi:hypothetical protein